MNTKRTLCFAVLVSCSVAGYSQHFVSARMDGVNFHQGELYDTAVATIEGRAGERILITRLGIGGDADADSGDALFRLHSTHATANFHFAGGQGAGMQWGSVGEIAHRLDPTPNVDASGRGFSLLDVSYLLKEGEGFTLNFRGTKDWDGRYTYAADPLGNFFDDSSVGSSLRGWIEFQVVPVPEPMTLAVLAPLALWRARRKRS